MEHGGDGDAVCGRGREIGGDGEPGFVSGAKRTGISSLCDGWSLFVVEMEALEELVEVIWVVDVDFGVVRANVGGLGG